MNTTYLLLGSNLGDSRKQLSIAELQIKKQIGKIICSSALYETAAWGKLDQPDFINQVIIVETSLSSIKTMEQILAIEESMGRIRSEKNAPRTIDIDILFFNEELIKTPMLTLPHPRIQQRRFVLVPLNELSPKLLHPLLHETIEALLRKCADKLEVKKI